MQFLPEGLKGSKIISAQTEKKNTFKYLSDSCLRLYSKEWKEKAVTSFERNCFTQMRQKLSFIFTYIQNTIYGNKSEYSRLLHITLKRQCHL